MQPRTLTTVDIRYVPLFEAAKVRLALSERKPLGRYPVRGFVAVVVTTGPPRGRNQGNDGTLLAEDAGELQLGHVNFKEQPPDGLPCPPWSRAHAIASRTSSAFGGRNPAIRKELTLQPSVMLDLGDIVIATPQAGNRPEAAPVLALVIDPAQHE
jgi:hypothetical protein